MSTQRKTKPFPILVLIATSIFAVSCVDEIRERVGGDEDGSRNGTEKQEDSQEPRYADITVSTSSVERDIFDQVNDYRKSQGLDPVALDSRMNQQARKHSREMAERGDIDHLGVEQRFEILQEAPTNLRSIAENVGLNRGVADPATRVVKSWIKSPTHEPNMTREKDVKTGIGVYRSSEGRYYMTQLFGY